MKSRMLAIALVASVVTATAPQAEAQTVGSAVGTALPVVLWAVTGAVIGAVAWPMVVGGSTAAAMAPGVMSASSLMNTGAAIGTVVGGAGYLMTR
jgi:hypothetical protein